MRLPLLLLAGLVPLSLCEVFPLNKQLKPPTIAPYSIGDDVAVECIQRQIDTGEHKFDADGNIIYGQFPVCAETGKPLSLRYGISDDFNCTVALTDEQFHLFQLYIHEDSPFSCRVPYSSNPQDAAIPFTLNFRGHLETSHLDIDTTMNVMAHKHKDGTIMTMIGYASGSQTKRYIIGDQLTIQFSVNWVEESHRHNDDTFFTVRIGFGVKFLWIVALASATIGGLLVFVTLYTRFNKKLIKELGYTPGFTTELGIASKKD
ncbi:unnamed protein product [Cyberlindnera jadinii]|uniref:Uncharacterized protein n=1 Tax=Cyberlindnera jadinii (strain ATCC 18201 / CBS 1600 / BCRC 20928 / JCM 3617 / NBRC 0987 / NRRL Y-1542) TaxID=983966 RepID=A0A0H5BYJ8_CYBJN|nr:hypothetical protein CYBJADRAFT_165250 [Cyberlindnera jadinii NRRL Y-1542]ODV75863.1 hypothetical protein CYBJADRAFT_165250 [Cyberlindnera jadinii NRRL Y-1542]CEP20565.1 unnamed protein product [Cyberlindnera jadinii]